MQFRYRSTRSPFAPKANVPSFRGAIVRSQKNRLIRGMPRALFAAILAILLAVETAVTPVYAFAAPSSYDPRELGLISDARDQAPWGMCWAFAGMAALESYAVTNGLADASIDLSEEAVPWAILNAAKESAGISPAYGWMSKWGTRDESGYADMMIGYFMSGKGPKLESDIPYYRGDDSDPFGSYYEETPPKNLSSALNALEVTDIVYLDGASVDEVKDAIMAYGGVVTSCDLSLDLYNPETAALWSPTFAESYANHAICIVGWDDTFPKENFVAQEGELPQQDGAWLVKNSELADGEVAPYIWISYEDGIILQSDPHNPSYAIAGARPVSQRTVHALDSDGAVAITYDEASEDSSALSCANVYEFAEGEQLTEAMFMTTSKGAHYRILYYPVDDSLTPIADPSRAVLLAEGTVAHAGYTTVELDQEASLPAGYGAIALELTSSGGSATIGVDENVDEYGNPLYTADPQYEVRSFYLRDGSAEPAFTEPHEPVTFVLRAYGTQEETPDEPGEPAPGDPDTEPDGTTDDATPDNTPGDDTNESVNTADESPKTDGKLASTGDNAYAVIALVASAGLLCAVVAAIIRFIGTRRRH